MDITFSCSKCGQHIAIDEAGAGLQVECPKCGQSLSVPMAAAITAPSSAKEPQPPAWSAESVPKATTADLPPLYVGIAWAKRLASKLTKPPTGIPPVITKLPPVIAQPDPTFRCKCGQHIAVDEAGLPTSIRCPKCLRFLPGKLRRRMLNAAHNKSQLALVKGLAGRAEWLALHKALFRYEAGKTIAKAERRAAEAESLNLLSESDRYGSPEVKREVWRRDQGRCVQCGSQEKLEYDHIIPVSKGGSNTERNVQLLCEKCNREKAARIA